MSNKIPSLNEEVHIGEDYQLSFRFLNPDGTTAILSGSSVISSFRYRQEDSLLYPLTVTLDIPTGTISLLLPDTTTVNMVPGVGEFDVVLIDSLLLKEVILNVTLELKHSPTLSPIVTP